MTNETKLKFTGERYIPGVRGDIESEHYHRYILATQLCSGLDVLDIASGEGYGSFILSAYSKSVTGVDISSEAIRHSNDNYKANNLKFLEGSCDNIPIETSTIDLVVSFETIEHHDLHRQMLAEIKRVLRPNGKLFISSPNKPEFNLNLTQPNIHHIKELDFFEFSSLLSQYFTNITYFGQRAINGSYIYPIESTDSCDINYLTSNQNRYNFTRKSPVYYLALAGFTAMPDINSSFFEPPPHSFSNSDHQVLEARIYISEGDSDAKFSYSETKSYSKTYNVDCSRSSLSIHLPKFSNNINSLRLDISNAPVFIQLHSISIFDSNSKLIWDWNGSFNSFKNSSGVFFYERLDSIDLICYDGDPRFDIDIPDDLLVKFSHGAFIRIDFTAKPITQEFPNFFPDLLKLQPDLNNSSHDLSSIKDCCLQASQYFENPKNLSNDLDFIYTKLSNFLQIRNMRIEALEKKIFDMHNEVARAYAQLDLLKDVFINQYGSDRF